MLIIEQAEFLKDVCKLIEYINNTPGWVCTGGELYRTQEQQDLHIRNGRSHTRDSMHLRRLAIDLNFFENKKLTYDRFKLRQFGMFWESLNAANRWGGSWRGVIEAEESSFVEEGKATIVDTPHFERRINA